MQTLILVGYWLSRQEPEWPDPAWFIDEAWDDRVRHAVLEHLGRGENVAVAAGVSWCRFRCGETNIGTAMCTDGTYVWPESLAHYLQVHDVRLPDSFVEHAMRAAPGTALDESATIVSEWWRAQRGWRAGRSYLTSGLDGRLLATCTPRTPLSNEAFLFLRGFPFAASYTNRELVEVMAHRSGVLLSETCDYHSYLQYEEQARNFGLVLLFEEPGD